MKPLPRDENNPLAGDANHDDLILWLAYKEAKAMIKFERGTAAEGGERQEMKPARDRPWRCTKNRPPSSSSDTWTPCPGTPPPS